MGAVATPVRTTAPLPSLRPALVVVGIAVFLVLGGAVLALVGTASARPAASRGPKTIVPGSDIFAQPAKEVLSHISSGGEPPANVVASLAVPAGSSYLGRKEFDRGVDQFDRQVEVSVDAPAAQVRTFYLKLLSEQEWTTSRAGSDGGRYDILATRSGDDGYQWEVGLLIDGVDTGVAPALAGGGASPVRTTVTIELQQLPDAS